MNAHKVQMTGVVTKFGKVKGMLIRGGVAGAVALATLGVEAQEEPASSSSGGLSELVVTATKRSEQLVSVAQSITALPERALTEFNIQGFSDYGNKIPNLSFNEGGAGMRASFTQQRGVTIRGIVGLNTTAMYIDDTAVPVSQNPRIVDIERIEVLKGPQGTLYGSGAIGGTIRLITKQPSLTEDSLKVMGQGGFTHRGGSADFGGNAVGNFVLVPGKLAVRTMAFVNHDSGYVTREFPLVPGAVTMTRVRDTGAVMSYGGSISLRAELTENLVGNLKFMAQQDDYPNGFPLVYRGLDKYDPSTYTIHREYNAPETGKSGWYLPALTLSYNRDNWSLVSATSFYSRKSSDMLDSSEAMHQVMASRYNNFQFAGPAWGGRDPSTTNRFQQELRGTADIGPVKLIGGGYYSRARNVDIFVDREIPGFVGSGFEPVGTTTNMYYLRHTFQTATEKALFGELSFQPIQQLTFTAGLRRYWLDQDNAVRESGFLLNLNTPRTVYTGSSESGFSPKFAAQFEPNPDTNIYVTAAKGFRPGAPGSPVTPFCAADLARLGLTFDDVLKGYKSDSVWTYEAGVKRQIANSRALITGAVFQTNWSNIQQLVSLSGCSQNITGNAGAARVRGFESEFSGNITEALMVRMGFGYIDAVITDDNQGATGQKVGDRLFGVPKSNATIGAVYTKALGSNLEGVLSADWSFVGSSVTMNNGTVTAERRGSYNILNMRFGVRRNDSELSFYVNNLTNTIANYGDHVPVITETVTLTDGRRAPYTEVMVSRPIQFGIQLRHGF
ncbi:MAG: TonB-dependent receptor [Steroidobacteraceae bacterium]